jgi:hypothetical protein
MHLHAPGLSLYAHGEQRARVAVWAQAGNPTAKSDCDFAITQLMPDESRTAHFQPPPRTGVSHQNALKSVSLAWRTDAPPLALSLRLPCSENLLDHRYKPFQTHRPG